MTESAAIETQIRQFLASNFGFRGATPDLDKKADLLDQGILDSTGVLEVIAFLEEEFSIKVADNEMLPDNLSSIDRMLGFVNRKQAAGA
jgi:acyl carrier protein